MQAITINEIIADISKHTEGGEFRVDVRTRSGGHFGGMTLSWFRVPSAHFGIPGIVELNKADAAPTWIEASDIEMIHLCS